jgi:hypothetical protein
MAWVAFDRTASYLKAQGLAELSGKWREIADEIHADVCERGFDRELGSFVQAYGSKGVDASLLLLPLVGFLPATDPRIRGTLQAIERKLLVNDEFVLRYETEDAVDGLPAGEGAFLVCSFWLVDNYILQGRYEEAQRLFNRLLTHCNDVGLLAEEFDPLNGRMLGNFPQAYSHVGVINCALNLSREIGPTEQRATSPVATNIPSSPEFSRIQQAEVLGCREMATKCNECPDAHYLPPAGERFLALPRRHRNDCARGAAIHPARPHCLLFDPSVMKNLPGFAGIYSRFCAPSCRSGKPRAWSRRDETNEDTTRPRSEPLARQYHPQPCEQRHAPTLHRRIFGDRADLESDNLRSCDQE